MPPRAEQKHRRATFKRQFDYPDDCHPLNAYLDGFTEASRRTMGSALDSIADILSDGKASADELAWHELRANHVAKLRGRMLELFAPATTNRYLTALRGVMKSAWRLDLIDRDTMEQTVDVAPARGKRVLRGRAVLATELTELFAACKRDPNPAIGARDAALLALLYGTGVRRVEAAGVRIEALDTTAGRMRVVGKGDKERDVYLPAGALAAVLAWVDHRGSAPGPLFNRVTKAGKVKDDGITAQLVYHVVKKRHLEAGVEPFAPHDLRRSFISELLDKGVDLSTVAKQVGHSNVQTTARYDRRDDSAQKRGVQRLDVPFSG